MDRVQQAIYDDIREEISKDVDHFLEIHKEDTQSMVNCMMDSVLMMMPHEVEDPDARCDEHDD